MLTATKVCASLFLVMGALLSENPQEVISAFRGGFNISDATVPVAEIRFGGPRRDGIATIDEPVYESTQESTLDDSDLVLGIVLHGVARAYPVKILARHHVVNDQLAGEFIAATYCPLCGAGAIFSTAASGTRITFGISGLVYNSETLLYDRQTASLWSQMLGKAISGPFRNVALSQFPTSRTTWAEWRNRFPDTQVLAEPRGSRFNYDQDPYAAYRRSKQLWFPVNHKSELLPAKELVLGVLGDQGPRAYPFSELTYSERGIVDTFGDQTIRIIWSAADKTAQAVDGEGRNIPYTVSYWFSWYAFHPSTSVYINPDKPAEDPEEEPAEADNPAL